MANRVALGSTDRDDDDLWLHSEGMRDHQEVVEDTPGFLRGGDHLLSQIDYLLGRGQEVSIVIDADPDNIARVMHRGVTALLFCHPKFSRPEFRPDYQHQVRPWDSIVQEIETQAALERSLPSVIP